MSADQIISQTKRYDVKRLHHFCSSLGSGARDVAETSVRLTDARVRPLPELVQEIVSGRLKAWFGAGGANTLSNLYLDGHCVEALGRIGVLRNRSDTVSTFRATRALKVGHPTLVALVRQERAPAVWQKERLLAISSEVVAKWSASFVTSAEVGKRVGISAASVTRRLKQLEVAPVLSAAPAAKIAAVWRCIDVDAVDFSRQWLTGCGLPCAVPKQARIQKLKRERGRSIPVGNISLAELAKLCLIDSETLRHLATAGFFEITHRTAAGCLRGVTRSSSKAFRRRYVSSSEIARQHDLSGAAVTRRLQFLGVEPILKAASDARIQMCWRRNDVAEIDFATQYMTACGRPSKLGRSASAKLLAPRPTGSPRLGLGAIYVHEATGLLGTNSASLRAIVLTGYVRAASQSVVGKILTVDEADVVAFAARYVFTPKLAAELGLSAKSLAHNLARLGIKPILAGSRPVHTLWDRESYDVASLLNRWVTASGALSQQSSLAFD